VVGVVAAGRPSGWRTDADPRRSFTVCYIRDARDREFAAASGRVARRRAAWVVERNRSTPASSALWRLVRSRGIDIIHAHDYKTDLSR
jgi:hypothetical protein